MRRKHLHIDPDRISFYLAHDVRVLPHVYKEYIDILAEMEYKDKVCLVPLTILQRYTYKFRKIA